jgi:hypothetical protein
MQHLDEGTVHAWLDGALSAEESAGVERHIAQCKECAALVAEARGMIAGASRVVSALDVVPGGVIPKAPRATTASMSLWRSLHLTPSRAALAATLVIAVSTLLTLRHDTPTKLVPTAAPPSPVVTSASPPAAAAEPSDKNALERPKADVAPPSARVAQPLRRDVPDTRIRVTDSMSAVSARSTKPSLAEVTAQNAATTKRVIAAAQPAAPAASGAGAVAADAVRPPLAKANVDTTQLSTRAAASAASATGFAARRLQRAEGIDFARQSSQVFVGCYQVTTDSTFKDGSLPRRFALASLRADTAENVIRAATPDGHMGDEIVGSHWTQISTSTIELQFPVRDKLQLVTIRFPAGTATGIATIVGDQSSATFTIRHTSCSP